VGALVIALSVPAVPASAAAPGARGADAGAAKKKKKKCKKGYKLVKVKVKKKRGGKVVTVKVKRCRKVRKAPVVVHTPPAPPTGPRISEVIGWSTTSVDPDTPPADLVANGGTITSCPNPGSLSVYVRRSGFTAIGLVSHVWKRNGAVIASSSNSNTYEGAFRYGLTINPINGVYEVVWSAGGATIASATVTRSC
jgi:hypothetical protein